MAVDDALLLRVFSPETVAQINVDIRMLNLEGVVIPTHVEFQTTAAGVLEQLFPVLNTEGFLLSASVTTFNVQQRGALFVQLAIRRGRDVVGIINGNTLVQGYVSDSDWITYPAHNSEPSRSGRGKLEVVSLTNGAGGADVGAGPAPGTTWKLRSAAFDFITDANVANRTPSFLVLSGFATITEQVAPAVVPAGTTMRYSCAPGATAGNLSNIVTLGFANDLEITDACEFRTNTLNLQAGDLWRGRLWVEKFVGRSG